VGGRGQLTPDYFSGRPNAAPNGMAIYVIFSAVRTVDIIGAGQGRTFRPHPRPTKFAQPSAFKGGSPAKNRKIAPTDDVQRSASQWAACCVPGRARESTFQAPSASGGAVAAD